MKLKFKGSKTPLYPVAVLIAATVLQCGKPSPIETQSLPTAVLSFSEPYAYDFGIVTVGTYRYMTFTITNDGDGPATEMSSTFVTQAFKYLHGYPGSGGNCGSELEPGESCEIVVQFEPPLATEYLELLRVTYFNGAIEVTTKKPSLSGRGVTP